MVPTSAATAAAATRERNKGTRSQRRATPMSYAGEARVDDQGLTFAERAHPVHPPYVHGSPVKAPR